MISLQNKKNYVQYKAKIWVKNTNISDLTYLKNTSTCKIVYIIGIRNFLCISLARTQFHKHFSA